MNDSIRRSLALLIAMSVLVAACGSASNESDALANSTSSVATTAETIAATTSTIPPTTSTTSVVATSTTSEAVLNDEVIPLEDVVGGTIRGEGWLVEPGRYTTVLGTHRYTFEVTEPVVYLDSDLRITFTPDTSSSTPEMFVLTHFVGVIPPDSTGEHAPHDPVVPTYTEPLPASLGTWLDKVPQFLPGDQMDLTLEAGVTARAWDVDVDGSTGGTFHCHFGDCVAALVQETEGVYVLFEDHRFRLWQLTGVGDGVYGFMQSRVSAFDEMVGLTDMLLNGMTIETVG